MTTGLTRHLGKATEHKVNIQTKTLLCTSRKLKCAALENSIYNSFKNYKTVRLI